MVFCVFFFVCFWFELSGINKLKNLLENICDIGLEKFVFIGEEVKGKYLLLGEGFIYFVGVF